MKKIKLFVALAISAGIIFSGCGASNTVKGAAIGGGGGVVAGTIVGALIGQGKGAAIGAAVGGVVGAGAGAIIGNKMDKQKAELEQINGTQVETVTDCNGLQAIKVVFDSGILFASGKSELSIASKTSLTNFATSLKNNPDTDVAIYGHTDSQGGDNVNVPLSEKRALSVQNYLAMQGVGAGRMAAFGRGSSEPVAVEDTRGVQALNRRVEIYISANAQMIQDAEQGR
ncbi:MAG: OmpA family protein [Prevotellaceae bacterium]|jgi:outer membrane protein OmpA-like peptidoglycan-associated protein|nr:OmpA family protein [Prevotellaceae bacterium]